MPPGLDLNYVAEEARMSREAAVMGRFEGKVIFISGAGSGMGRECAFWWAEEGGKIVE
jgi:hypothetical protein